MAIDSTAELLFKINANSDDAEDNIKRFRSLMGKDLDGMAAEFKDWADEVIGEIDSVKGAMTAGLAAVAAGVIAVTAGIGEATHKYMEFADEVDHAMRTTGLSAEVLSNLHSAAEKSQVSFEALSSGLVRFEGNVVKASQGSKPQIEAFKALGVSQKDVIAGQKDMIPLLEKVMDGFHNNASAVQKAALARDLFSRSGPELLAFLSKGSDYLKENAAAAEKLGLILSDKDVIAAREFKLAQKELAEESSVLAVTVGKHVVPMMEKFASMAIASIAAIKQFAKGGVEGFKAPLVFLREYEEELANIKRQVAAAGNPDQPVVPIETTKIKEAKTEFQGLVSIVESMKSKIAEQGTGWDRLTEEVAHYHVEIGKATTELAKLQKAGSITPESLKASQAALNQIPTLLAKVIADTTAKLNADDTQRWGEAILKSVEATDRLEEQQEQAGERRVEVTREIADRETAAEETGYAQQRAQLQSQMSAWAAALAKKTQLTVDDWNAIERITAAGLAKIDSQETAAWQEKIAKLQEHLDTISEANATDQQKLYLVEQRGLQQYSQIEEDKVIKTAQTEAQVLQIQQLYASLRAQIIEKYKNDLQKLYDSQGFQGVFGNFFANLIRNNQNLMRQWAASTNQSLLLVKVSLQALKDMAQQAFQTFVQGMGQAIAVSLVGKTSIAQAMEAMLKSTLESFAGQAITAAIMATAWGFYYLMMGDAAAAAAAFTSAALFGTVGAVAAVAGGLMPGGSQSGSAAQPAAGRGGAAGPVGGYGSAGAASAQGGGAQQPPSLFVNVQGPVVGVSGIQQLISMINDAVVGGGATLMATHNGAGVPIR